MKISEAIERMSALAQESRLEIFRALARETPAGLAAGDLAESLGVPPSTLSFHLDHMVSAGLLSRAREGRSIRYAIDGDGLNELLWFLGEDCCQGHTALCASPLGRIADRVKDAAVRHEKPRVLFMCTRNSARSQMAESILRRHAPDRFEVASCGIKPAPIHPLTLRVLEEAGLDTSSLKSKDLGDFLGKVTIHHAVIVCEAANEHCPRLHPFALKQSFWPFPDPVAVEGTDDEKLEAFRSVRDAIEERIREWLETSPA